MSRVRGDVQASRRDGVFLAGFPGANSAGLFSEAPTGRESKLCTAARLGKQLVGPALYFILVLMMGGCEEKKADPKAEAPPTATVQPDLDANNFKVDHPEQFPLVAATEHKASPALNVTGVIQPDIARAVPVISLAAGRVVEVKARLGDTVKKGQLLMKVQSNDVAAAYQSYRKSVNDELLARVNLDRQKLLFEKGAVSKSALEQAEDVAKNAQADLDATSAQLRLLGVDKDHPSGIVDIFAPISGIITDQQVTSSAGVQGLGSPNPFVISDLSYVWIICDVYENDLDAVKVGETADIHLTAFPDKIYKGRIDNILPVLDPTLRTTKVRLEVSNPGIMRVGMFVTATFYGKQPVTRSVVPSTAILHLHDREWVYAPLGNNHFKRTEVVTGSMLPNHMQEVVTGLKPGDEVVSNALVLQNTVEQ